MRIPIPSLSHTRRAERGGLLLMTLMVLAILGFTLASYLSLVSAQNRSISRSQTWNSVMPLVEAGIEEAMAHLNQNGLTNLYTDGWYSLAGMAVKRRQLGEGRYVVSITGESRPVIECTAYVPAPLTFAASSSSSFFADYSYDPFVRRKGEVYRSVRCTTGGGAYFAKGMVAKGSIDMNGNNVSTDSFDSADPNFNTNGQYDASKRKDNGDVATNSGQPGMFDAGNANIRGRVMTGPGGSVAIGPNGTVGSLAWVGAGTSGIEPGHFSDDMNMSFPSIDVPFSGGFTPGGGTVSVTNYTYGSNVVTSSYYPTNSADVLSSITTNYGITTTAEYPSGFVMGAVVTNYSTVTSTSYPDGYTGAVTTNTLLITTNSLPSTLPAGTIFTNLTWVTNVSLPSPVPSGTIVTNAVFASVRYPFSPMPPGPPSNAPAWTPPTNGTFVGVVTNRYKSTGASASRGWWHDYQAICSYAYYNRTFTFAIPNSYTYQTITYSYSTPLSYSYYARSSTNISVVSSSYDYVLDSGNYVLDTLSGTVYVRGTAVLLVRNSISMSGKDCITIGPSGSLTLYMVGASAKIAGQGVLNPSGQAFRFIYYGLDSNTSLDLSGNGGFTGAIYAPNAAFKLSGGGNNTDDFIGASVTSSVTMNGHFNFHYDEDLARRGPRSRYTITSWNEVAPDDTRVITLLKPFYQSFGGW